MRLTERTDYAMRTLMYLGASDGRKSVSDMAERFGVSVNHLSKVVQTLVEAGLVATSRGRGGGVELARTNEQINVGQVVRLMEPDLALAECFRDDGQCPFYRPCALRGHLDRARAAFLKELDAVTLADLVRGRERRLYTVGIAS